MRAIILVAAAVLAALPITRAESGARRPELFAFRSGFWLNLHHYLHAQARLSAGFDSTREAMIGVAGDTAGFAALSAAERRAWESAVAYYRDSIARRDITFDSSLIRFKLLLADTDDSTRLRAAANDSSLVRHLLATAPIYRARWWRSHDSTNRAWIAAADSMLGRYGRAIAEGVARAFAVEWPSTPVPVDVSAYAGWAGAYATAPPPHVTISSTAPNYRGTLGLEMLFHEALHTMEDSLAAARRRNPLASGRRAPYDVSHAIIFFTAGEVTRRVVDGHVPYRLATGLERRGSMSRYFPIVTRHWPDRIDGRITVDSAYRAITGEL